MPRPRGRRGIDLVQADYEALAEFRHTLRRFLSRSASAARAAGVTPQQHQALLAIKGHAGDRAISIGELAERLVLRHHSAGELVERLLQAGLVERRAEPTDRRRSLLLLTGRAERLLATLSAIHLDEVRKVQPALRRVLATLKPE